MSRGEIYVANNYMEVRARRLRTVQHVVLAMVCVISSAHHVFFRSYIEIFVILCMHPSLGRRNHLNQLSTWYMAKFNNPLLKLGVRRAGLGAGRSRSRTRYCTVHSSTQSWYSCFEILCEKSLGRDDL